MQVEWEHHSSELVESLTEFLTQGALQDVTLCSSEGKRIKAHRVILAASSAYFKVRKRVLIFVLYCTAIFVLKMMPFINLYSSLIGYTRVK